MMPLTARTRTRPATQDTLSIHSHITDNIAPCPLRGQITVACLAAFKPHVDLLRAALSPEGMYVLLGTSSSVVQLAAWLFGGLGCISHRTASSQKCMRSTTSYVLRPASCVLRLACLERRGRWRAVACGLAEAHLALPYVGAGGCDLLAPRDCGGWVWLT